MKNVKHVRLCMAALLLLAMGVTASCGDSTQKQTGEGTQADNAAITEAVTAEDPALADNLPESVTVTEVGGTSHTVHLREFVSDGSSGTAIFENDRNTVTVHRISPHLRTIEVTRTVAALKENGVVISDAPGW